MLAIKRVSIEGPAVLDMRPILFFATLWLGWLRLVMELNGDSVTAFSASVLPACLEHRYMSVRGC